MIAITAAWAAVSGLFSAARWASRLAKFTDGHDGVASAALALTRDRAGRALGVAIEPRTWLWVVGVVAVLTALAAYTWFVADWQSKAERLAARERAIVRNVELEATSADAVQQFQAERVQRVAAEEAVRRALAQEPTVEIVEVERRVEVPVRVPTPSGSAPAHTPPDLREKLNAIK